MAAQNLPPVMTLEALRSVPLFASLDDSATQALRGLLEVRQLEADSLIFRAGEDGDAMYLIEDGRVRIHINDASGDDVTLAELARGDFFGEMAILDGKPRAADATAVEETRLAVLSRDDFHGFARDNPEVLMRMLSAITNRLRHTDDLLRTRVSRNLNDEVAERMTMADRFANYFADLSGSWKFIGVFLLLLTVWVTVNSLLLNLPFDPPPSFDLLGLVLGVIAGIQVPFVLMSQDRQEQKDRLRADLDYQVNLKNELALAEVLRRLDVLESERLPILFGEQNARFEEMVADANKQG